MRYSEKFLNYFYQSQHVGCLKGPGVKKITVGSVDQGDLLELYLLIDDRRVIQQARFKAYGSAVLIAGSEYICSYLEGKTVEQGRALSSGQLLKDLQLPPLKIHTATLLARALMECIKE
jgi:nitrogen fixation NifU-like protein